MKLTADDLEGAFGGGSAEGEPSGKPATSIACKRLAHMLGVPPEKYMEFQHLLDAVIDEHGAGEEPDGDEDEDGGDEY